MEWSEELTEKEEPSEPAEKPIKEILEDIHKGETKAPPETKDIKFEGKDKIEDVTEDELNDYGF